MHTRRMVVSVVALCALFVSVCMLPEAAASEGSREPAKPLAEMTVSASRIDWQPASGSEHLVLTIAGPEELWLRKDFEAGQPASLSLSDTERLPDGSYTWELRVVSPSGKLPQKSHVESGHFFVKDGTFVAARKKADSPRPPHLLTAEASFVDGDLAVKGNACIGTSCTVNDADYSSLKIKAPQPNILFDDDFVEGGSTPHDWALFINPSSAAEFSIADVENQRIPFTVAGGAPNSSVYVASNGNVGLGTATPGTRLHLYGSATSDAAVGTGPDPVSGPAFNFGYAGATFGRSAGFFNVRPDASATAPNPSLRFLTANVERMIVTNTGNVGIGTTSPATKLHVSGSSGTTQGLIEETNGTTAFRTMLELRNNGASRLNFTDSSTGSTWGINNNTGNVNMIRSGTGGIVAFSLQPNGNLTVAGTVTQGSDRDTKRDIAPVQPEEILAKVANLPITTWNRKTDSPSVRHMGPMAQDFAAVFGLGDDDRHIAILDIAGVSLASIQALSHKITDVTAQKDEEIAQLRRENAALAQRLAALEALVLQGRRVGVPAPDLPPTP